MDEKRALALLAKGKEEGLAWVMDAYGAYVGAVVWNILGRTMTAQDAEETVSDVFVTLWRNRAKPRPGQLKGYLGHIARSRAINKLRRAGGDLALEEDLLEMPGDGPEALAVGRERDEAVRRAVVSLGPPDSEIFVRHYYYCESAAQIGGRLGLTAEAVRQRLRRGRAKLRLILTEGGSMDETAYL